MTHRSWGKGTITIIIRIAMMKRRYLGDCGVRWNPDLANVCVPSVAPKLLPELKGPWLREVGTSQFYRWIKDTS